MRRRTVGIVIIAVAVGFVALGAMLPSKCVTRTTANSQSTTCTSYFDLGFAEPFLAVGAIGTGAFLIGQTFPKP